MDTTNKEILVIGASGKQGGATMRHLIRRGWRVRAFCRNLEHLSLGEYPPGAVAAVVGNLDDANSVRRALRGCYGLFGVLTFWGNGLEGEVRQGKLLADLALETRVRHFVYSSVSAANLNTGIPHFETKWEIEEYIRSLNLPATFVRPVWFMDNFETYYHDSILGGQLRLPMPADRKLQMIAVEDIARVATECFERPEEFLGQAVDIAGDELTLTRTAELLGQTIGRTVRYAEQPLSEMETQNREFARMFRWFADTGYQVGIAGLRKRFPDLLTFEQFLPQSSWAKTRREAAVGVVD